VGFTRVEFMLSQRNFSSPTLAQFIAQRRYFLKFDAQNSDALFKAPQRHPRCFSQLAFHILLNALPIAKAKVQKRIFA
jgi:hypothetical protein